MRAPLAPVVAGILLGLPIAACGGEPAGEEAGVEADTPLMVADTQLVRDTSGVVLEIVTRRRGDVREVKPRAGSGDPDAPDVLRALAPKTVHELMQGADPAWYVIDVRDARAWVAEGHLPGALLVPIEVLEANVEDLHVRTDQVVLVYGAEDPREARRAGRLLASYGYPTVRILEGGFPAWRRAGLPVEGGP